MTSVTRPDLYSTIRDMLGRPAPQNRARPASKLCAVKGHVSLVGAGPGSADLITMRGLQKLQQADVVYYDRLADPALLHHVRRGAAKVFVGKAPGCHAVPQHEINQLIVRAALRGQQVVRLKCGDPGVFGRGAEEAAACDAAGVAWDIVPGGTAACAAAASARTFLTERGLTERLILATGHLRHDGAQDWTAAAQPGTTLACDMGVAQSGAIMRGLIGGRLAGRGRSASRVARPNRARTGVKLRYGWVRSALPPTPRPEPRDFADPLAFGFWCSCQRSRSNRGCGLAKVLKPTGTFQFN